jgi:hypothetical protein
MKRGSKHARLVDADGHPDWRLIHLVELDELADQRLADMQRKTRRVDAPGLYLENFRR